MADRTIDRRIARTRALLQDALISLMAEQGYEQTTVQQIIDRANVGRATFYAHFPDKHALLDSGLENLRVLLTVERAKQAPDRLRFSLPMLEHARGHLPLYRSIARREAGGHVLQKIREIVADLIRDDLKALRLVNTRERAELAVQFLSGAFMAVMIWWMERGARESAQDVDAVFHGLVMHGLLCGARGRRTGGDV